MYPDDIATWTIVNVAISGFTFLVLVLTASILAWKFANAFKALGEAVKEANGNILLLMQLGTMIAKELIQEKQDQTSLEEVKTLFPDSNEDFTKAVIEGVNKSEAVQEAPKPEKPQKKKKAKPRMARMTRGSQEAKDRMAQVRAAKKQKEEAAAAGGAE